MHLTSVSPSIIPPDFAALASWRSSGSPNLRHNQLSVSSAHSLLVSPFTKTSSIWPCHPPQSTYIYSQTRTKVEPCSVLLFGSTLTEKHPHGQHGGKETITSEPAPILIQRNHSVSTRLHQLQGAQQRASRMADLEHLPREGRLRKGPLQPGEETASGHVAAALGSFQSQALCCSDQQEARGWQT